MSIKLRELIRNVRACKTAAEERAVIQKECALIRTAFKSKDNSYRHRNVAKLLYIHMLGFPTHFGQMECLKLIASPNFPEKRIGYLGLMVLLDERQKVLMLVTNSLKQDFSHQNPYVVGLSLCALGNISTADMARDLYNEVEKFFRNSNPYLRKKAALCAIRIVRKVPELVDEFVPGANALLNDQNNGVLVTGITLVIEMLKASPKLVTGFRKSVPTLVRVLKNLLLGGYVNEYDVSGITDPFLQTRIIHLLRLLGHGNAEASEFMNDILAQVAINTEPTKNPGNAILYECVQTIMSIEAENGLRVLAINILGRFLQNRDNNIRYVALNTLCKVVERDTQAIQRHRNTVVECLKDADISIRRRALDLIYALVTRNNVKALVKELLNYLALTSGDTDFKSDLTDKICLVAQRFAPSKRWHIDTVISVLAIAGNYTKDNVATDLMALIARSKTLHAYSVHRLYSELRKSIIHLPLVHTGLWCIGEYGESLVTDDGVAKANLEKSNNFEVASEGKVLDVIAKVMKSTESKLLTKEYALNCLVKLIVKYQNESGRLRQLIASYNTSMSLELQQRSCEYSQLFSDQLAKIRAGVVAKMPMPPKKKKEKVDEKGNRVSGNTNDKEEGEDSGPELDEEAGETNDGEEDEEERRAKAAVPGTSASKKAGGQQIEGQVKSATVDKKDAGSASVLPFDIFAGTGINGAATGPSTSGTGAGATANILESALGSTSTANPVAVAPKNDLDILSELFAPGAPGGAGNNKPNTSSGAGNLASILGGSTSTTSVPNPAASTFPFGVFDTPPASNPSPSPVKVAESKYPPVVVYESKGLSVKFAFEINSSQPEVCNVTASFSNSGSANFTNFDFQVAVPKFITLKMQPPSSTTVAAGAGSSSAPVTQQIRLENTQHGKKKLLIKVRIVYQVNGVAVTEDAQISQFPDTSS